MARFCHTAQLGTQVKLLMHPANCYGTIHFVRGFGKTIRIPHIIPPDFALQELSKRSKEASWHSRVGYYSMFGLASS